MTRNIFAITVAGLIIAAISGGSQAAPIAPLGADVIDGDVTKAWWGDCWRDRRGRVHCRRCWYGPRGHVHCT
jgi:hypothetical protein